ncbi:MAG: serine/threonine-protein kinase [Myxococcota bacterium]
MSTGTDFSDPESRAFLQKRVASVGAGFAVIGIVCAVCRALISGTFGTVLARPIFPLAVAAILPGAAMWWICRRGELPVMSIKVLEACGILTTAGLYVAMGTYIPAEVGADTMTAFLLSFVLFARVVYVPSTVRHTIILGVAMGIPLVIAMYFHYRDANLQLDWDKIGWDEPPESDEVIARVSASVTTMWWMLAVGLAALATRVIHGLRKEIRDIKRLGQYTLERKLGEGGMGVVFQATHGMLKRPTAIKLLRSEQVSLDAQARFQREVQLTAKLTHPHTVRIHDYGRTPDGIFYYAMEYLEGATVREIVEAFGPQPVARVVHVLRHAALALNEAHSMNLIHRDIKPSNIMLAKQGGEFDVTKVLDFGLVKNNDVASQDRTDSSVVMGTPHYLSPESIHAAGKVCPQSDIYALGAVGYYLLTGRHIFDGETIMEVCVQHIQSTPPPVSEARGEPIPAELENLIMACLAKDPEGRPPSARALARALECLPLSRWTLEDSEAWWQRFGDLLSSDSGGELLSGHNTTVAIDLSYQ